MFWSSLLTKIPGFRSPFWLGCQGAGGVPKKKLGEHLRSFPCFWGKNSKVLVWSTGNDCDLCLACYHQKGVEQTHHAIRTKLDVATTFICCMDE